MRSCRVEKFVLYLVNHIYRCKHFNLVLHFNYEHMGADCVSEIDAQFVYGYALFKDGKSTKLSYPLGSFDLNVAGRSFHHGRFVQRMREKAASLPKYLLSLLIYSFCSVSLTNRINVTSK